MVSNSAEKQWRTGILLQSYGGLFIYKIEKVLAAVSELELAKILCLEQN